VSGWNRKRIPLRFAEALQFQGARPVQEDYYEYNSERGIFALADGFGGTPGARAAELAVKSARQFMEQEAGDLDATLPFELRPYYSLAGNVLLNAVSFANQKVIQMNQGKGAERSGGASMIAGFIEGRLLSIAQVGACRLTLKRAGETRTVVTPRTLLGQVDPFLEEGPGSGVPLMSLGTAKRLEPEITEIELRPGDQVFVESSGINKRFRERIAGVEDRSQLSQLIDEFRGAFESNASLIWLSF
jgi:serine/threonine protein phosphatase PrpC